MDYPAFLKTYHCLSSELRMMRCQRDRLRDRLAMFRHDLSTSTKLKRHIEYLDRLIAEAQGRLSELQPQFDAIVVNVTNERLRLIIHHYYGMGLTDMEVADLMECSQRTVNASRNRFLRSLGNDASA